LERLEPRRLLAPWSGQIPDGTVWQGDIEIVGHAWNELGDTLTIMPGTTIRTDRYSYNDYIYDFNIWGTVNATEAEFSGYTDLKVRDGGTLNLTRSTVSGSNADKEISSVDFLSGARGTAIGSTFSIPLGQYSGTKADPLVSFSGNTFLSSTPLYTYAALAEAFYDNTFACASGVSTIIIAGGTLSEDASWQVAGTASRYLINNHFTVDAGATLEIGNGVEVSTNRYSYNDYIYDFNVHGTVDATGVNFTGSTDLKVHNGGTLNLAGSTVSGSSADYEDSWVGFSAGARGTVTDSTFNIPLKQYSGTKATPLVSFSGNTFQASAPVYTYGALVEEFYDNTFNASGGLSTIVIQGGLLSENASWQVAGTASRYLINDHFTVDAGTTLEIGNGVEVSTNRYDYNDYIYNFNVSGAVEATGVNFTGSTDLNILSGGRLKLISSTVSGSDADYEDSWVAFSAGAQGTVIDSTFNIPVTQYSGTKQQPLVLFRGNTFLAADPVYTYGALVEEFYDNTFNHAGGISTITIQGGTLAENASWQVVGTASRYLINNHFTIDADTLLTIGDGVEVSTSRYDYNDYIYNFDIDGTLNATGVEFSQYTDLNVRDGGTLNLTGATVWGANADYEDSWVEFRAGSTGTLTESTLNIPIALRGSTDASCNLFEKTVIFDASAEGTVRFNQFPGAAITVNAAPRRGSTRTTSPKPRSPPPATTRRKST